MANEEEVQRIDDQSLVSDGELCPHCGERFSEHEASRCPICLGNLRAVESLREHAWRHHDDRVDVAEFERWLAGGFEIDGLRDHVAEEPATTDESVSQPGLPSTNDEHGAPENRDPNRAPNETRVAGEAPAPSEGDSVSQSPPDTDSETDVGIGHSVQDETSPLEQEDDWPPHFSPGLRINFRAQPLKPDPSASHGANAQTHDAVGRSTNHEPGHRAGPHTETRRRKPPVLIIDGPGPVLFAGRPARSVIMTERHVLIGRSSPDGRGRVDIDLGAYHRYDRLIARRHARIYHDRNLWFIEDFANNDATFLYGRAKPLNLETVPLRDGDKILIGDSVRLRFHVR